MPIDLQINELFFSLDRIFQVSKNRMISHSFL